MTEELRCPKCHGSNNLVEMKHDKLGQFFYCKYCDAKYNMIQNYWYWQVVTILIKGVRYQYG